MIRTQTLTVPGREIALTLPMGLSPTPCPEVAPCVSAIQGLFWFSDLTGDFTEISEAVYLLAAGAAGPLLGMARVLGETCGEVAWSHQWTPADGAIGGGPGLVNDGARLIVYPLATTVPGLLSVSATVAGQSFGPIVLTLLRYVCGYGYTDPTPPAPSLRWEDGSTAISAPAGSSIAAHTATLLNWPEGVAFDWVYYAPSAALVSSSGNTATVTATSLASGDIIEISVTSMDPAAPPIMPAAVTITVA